MANNILKVYALFQTDLHKSHSSRVFFGIFDSEVKAIDKAKEEDLYTSDSEVVILECTMNEFYEQ